MTQAFLDKLIDDALKGNAKIGVILSDTDHGVFALLGYTPKSGVTIHHLPEVKQGQAYVLRLGYLDMPSRIYTDVMPREKSRPGWIEAVGQLDFHTKYAPVIRGIS